MLRKTVNQMMEPWTRLNANMNRTNKYIRERTLMSIKFALLDVAGALSIPGSAVASFRNNAWNNPTPHQRHVTRWRDKHRGGRDAFSTKYAAC